mmetsp:Transcript_11192/g.46622  ORF Transcript_11192/g.46622 Transcript_11192/m.46622 type:complete len:230 (-) Transcript_11192:259-948(-)
MRAHERQKHLHLLLEVARGVRLLEADGGGRGGGLVHGDVLGRAQAETREALDGLRLRGREEQRLAPARDVFQDGLERRSKAHVKAAVSLVEHEHLHSPRVELGALVHVLQQAAGRRDHHVGAGDRLALHEHVLATGEQGGGQRVLVGHLAQLDEYLLGELARGREHERAHSVLARPAQPVQALHHGNQKCQRLSRARLGRAEHVAPGERERQRRRLDGGERLEARCREC